MKKRIFTAIVSMILVLTFCIPVSAAGIKKYYPEGDKKVTNLWNKTFSAVKGKSKMWTEPHYERRENSWIKAHYNNKLIYERHLIRNRPMPWNE